MMGETINEGFSLKRQVPGILIGIFLGVVGTVCYYKLANKEELLNKAAQEQVKMFLSKLKCMKPNCKG